MAITLDSAAPDTGAPDTGALDTAAGRPRLRRTVLEDLRRSSPLQLLLLGSTLAWFGYEWGPGNEALVPWVVVRILRSDGPSSWLVAVVAGAVITFVQQVAAGLTTFAALQTFRGTADALREWSGGLRQVRWETATWWQRGVAAFGLGTSALALGEQLAAGAPSRRRVVVHGAALCASMVAVLAAIAGGATRLAQRFDATRGPIEAILDVLGSPVPWLALVAVVAVRGATSRARRRARPG